MKTLFFFLLSFAAADAWAGGCNFTRVPEEKEKLAELEEKYCGHFQALPLAPVSDLCRVETAPNVSQMNAYNRMAFRQAAKCRSVLRSTYSMLKQAIASELEVGTRVQAQSASPTSGTGSLGAFQNLESLHAASVEGNSCLIKLSSRILQNLATAEKELVKEIKRQEDIAVFFPFAKNYHFVPCEEDKAKVLQMSAEIKSDLRKVLAMIDEAQTRVSGISQKSSARLSQSQKALGHAQKSESGISSVDSGEKKVSRMVTPTPDAASPTAVAPDPTPPASTVETESAKVSAAVIPPSQPAVTEAATVQAEAAKTATGKGDRLVKNALADEPIKSRFGYTDTAPVTTKITSVAPAKLTSIAAVEGHKLTAVDYAKLDEVHKKAAAEVPQRAKYAAMWKQVPATYTSAATGNTLEYQAALNDAYNQISGGRSGYGAPNLTQDGVLGSRTKAATSHLLSTPEGKAALEAALRARGLL